MKLPILQTALPPLGSFGTLVGRESPLGNPLFATYHLAQCRTVEEGHFVCKKINQMQQPVFGSVDAQDAYRTFEENIERNVLDHDAFHAQRKRFVDQVRMPLSFSLRELTFILEKEKTRLPDVKQLHPSFHPTALREAMQEGILEQSAVLGFVKSMELFLMRSEKEGNDLYVEMKLRSVLTLASLVGGIMVLMRAMQHIALDPASALAQCFAHGFEGQTVHTLLTTALETTSMPHLLFGAALLLTSPAVEYGNAYTIRERLEPGNNPDVRERVEAIRKLLHEYREVFKIYKHANPASDGF